MLKLNQNIFKSFGCYASYLVLKRIKNILKYNN